VAANDFGQREMVLGTVQTLVTSRCRALLAAGTVFP
jgi:hypothetical protein